MTLISYQYKFVFLANMKCASTTIHKLLEKFSDEVYVVSKFEKPLGRHATAFQVKQYLEEKGYSWDDFFVFTTIRDPYTRIVSCYKYEKVMGRDLPDFKTYILKNRFMNEHFVDINSFLSESETSNVSNISNTSNTSNINKRMLVNKENIIKVEELNQKFPDIINRLGIPLDIKKLPYHNNIGEFTKNVKNNDSFNYDEAMIQHLKKQNIKDFEYYQ